LILAKTWKRERERERERGRERETGEQCGNEVKGNEKIEEWCRDDTIFDGRILGSLFAPILTRRLYRRSDQPIFVSQTRNSAASGVSLFSSFGIPIAIQILNYLSSLEKHKTAKRPGAIALLSEKPSPS